MATTRAMVGLGTVVCGLAVTGCGGGFGQGNMPNLVGPSVTDIARVYTNYPAASAPGVLVNANLAMLCRGVTPQDLDNVRRQHGPHANAAITVRMNDVALTAFSANAFPYPMGSVVVKEKHLGSDWADRPRGRIVSPPEGIGGMVKRSPGYDPEHGDWEYFYFEDPSKIEQGKIESCVGCHSSAKVKDYVFGTWTRAGK
jgi:hypothetical protein